MSTVPLSSEAFRAMLREEGITLVEFWGAWCAPCVAYLPVFEAASEAYPDVRFATVDTQAEVTLAAELGVSGVPAIHAYRDGVLLMSHAGPLTIDLLGDVVAQLKALDMEDVIARAIAREPLPTITPASR